MRELSKRAHADDNPARLSRIERFVHPAVVKGRLLWALTLLSACTDGAVEVLQLGPPTYYEDVTPILARGCWCCHRSGGTAYDLTDVGQVEADVDAIVESMQSGAMPPAPAPDPGCAALDEPTASAQDLDVLRAWDAGGRLLGDPALAAAVPPPCGVLEGPVRRFSNGGYTFTGATAFESRCFVLDARFEEDQFLVGAHFDPGSSAVSWVLLEPAPAGHGPGDAFECGSDALPMSLEILAFWTPRSSDLIFPAGSGSLIAAGSSLMLRVRYDMAIAEEPVPVRVETAVSMAVVPSVDRLGELAVTADPLSLPPGTDRAEAESTTFFRAGVRLHEVAVAMHGRGRSARLELDEGGVTRCLLDVPAWDAGATRLFRLATPVDAGNGTLRLTCVYDTTRDDEPVRWGDPPSGEACLAAAVATIR